MAHSVQKQLYLGAADHISDPARWTTGFKGILWPSYKACAFGAMLLVGKRLGLPKRRVRAIVGEDRIAKVTGINDKQGREAVIAHLREEAATF